MASISFAQSFPERRPRCKPRCRADIDRSRLKSIIRNIFRDGGSLLTDKVAGLAKNKKMLSFIEEAGIDATRSFPPFP
jgi:hypothetical protein